MSASVTEADTSELLLATRPATSTQPFHGRPFVGIVISNRIQELDGLVRQPRHFQGEKSTARAPLPQLWSNESGVEIRATFLSTETERQTPRSKKSGSCRRKRGPGAGKKRKTARCSGALKVFGKKHAAELSSDPGEASTSTSTTTRRFVETLIHGAEEQLKDEEHKKIQNIALNI